MSALCPELQQIVVMIQFLPWKQLRLDMPLPVGHGNIKTPKSAAKRQKKSRYIWSNVVSGRPFNAHQLCVSLSSLPGASSTGRNDGDGAFPNPTSHA